VSWEGGVEKRVDGGWGMERRPFFDSIKEGRPDSFVVLSPVQDILSGDEGFGVQTTHGAKEDQEPVEGVGMEGRKQRKVSSGSNSSLRPRFELRASRSSAASE